MWEGGRRRLEEARSVLTFLSRLGGDLRAPEGIATVEDMERRQWDTFIVRVFSEHGSELTGQVQHVLTGEKYRFQGIEELLSAISRLRRRDEGA